MTLEDDFEMTVKINRYEIVDDIYLPGEATGKAIYDFLTHKIIISVRTNNAELNQRFAERLLNELNTGDYEGYLTGDDNNGS